MPQSPRAVARETLRRTRETLPTSSSPFSRPDATPHQLFALVARKTFVKTDERGLPPRLADFAALGQDLGRAGVRAALAGGACVRVAEAVARLAPVGQVRRSA